MSMGDFLKDLPTQNSANFTKLHSPGITSSSGDAGSGGSMERSWRPHQVRHARPAVYVPTKDIPSDQIIVTERTNILLRFLHRQWDKKAAQSQRKREAEEASASSESGLSQDTGPGGSAKKKRRIDTNN